MADKNAKTDAPASSENSAPADSGARPMFKVKRQVTAALLKIENDKTVYVRFECEPYKAKPAATSRAPREGEAVQEPPIIARVTNLETGELCEIILGQVLVTELADAYPEGVTGRGFQITKHKLESKRYNTYEIAELEL